MELLPSEYKNLELTTDEKKLLHYVPCSEDEFGLFLIGINPAAISEKESIHAVILPEGVVFLKMLPFDKPEMLEMFVNGYRNGLYNQSLNIIRSKLQSNKSLVGSDGKLIIPFSFLLVFPNLEESALNMLSYPDELRNFLEYKCIFKDEFSGLRKNFKDTFLGYLKYSDADISKDAVLIGEHNINSILQRIAPEYITVRYAGNAADIETTAGANEDMLVVTEDDIAVRAFRLDKDQINYVNRIVKGEQLVLACAGSGKSVMLIAKAFKAARANPDKQFLITCFNRNLYSLYTWFIERAGLKERNVTCLTFDTLCRTLLEENKLFVPSGRNDDETYERIRAAAFKALSENRIKTRYYGIFIDEVQMFETDWYKFTYDLLEHRDTDDHLFVICGDKTQRLKKLQKHGQAPWNAGDGYPKYLGGKSIRIEKNYRNCVQINEYINLFANLAKNALSTYAPDIPYDPDLFLRGKSERTGADVVVKQVPLNAMLEAEAVLDSVKELHDKNGIPYDEIAVIFHNKKFSTIRYYLESALDTVFARARIAVNKMYHTQDSWMGRYGNAGVSFVSYQTTLGLDFNAAVVCGLPTLGLYDKTKYYKEGVLAAEEASKDLESNINNLYVACTRARDYLHIVVSDKPSNSLYAKLIVDSFEGRTE